jgi:alkaline phosphatase
MNIKIIGLCLLLIILPGYTQNSVVYPKNIILFIGDGMGLGQISALASIIPETNFDRFKIVGLLKTHSADNYITDSGASATAYSTGVKTNNKFIALSPSGDTLKTVVEYAEEEGKSTGLVVTCQMTHATPASFAAHVDSRYKHDEIARQMASSSVDVLIGGAKEYFIPQDREGSKRKDDLDLMAQIGKRMSVISGKNEFEQDQMTQSFVYLYSMGTPGKRSERPHTLQMMTEKAIKALSQNKKGFFLMVEGSQIDWGGHDNDMNYLLSEMEDFDQAIGAGLDFALRDRETLVIVTADHETGGLALLGRSEDHSRHEMKSGHPKPGTEDADDAEKNTFEIEHSFASKNHTGIMVPIFAHGPMAELFGGINDNTYVGQQIILFTRLGN